MCSPGVRSHLPRNHGRPSRETVLVSPLNRNWWPAWAAREQAEENRDMHCDRQVRASGDFQPTSIRTCSPARVNEGAPSPSPRNGEGNSACDPSLNERGSTGVAYARRAHAGARCRTNCSACGDTRFPRAVRHPQSRVRRIPNRSRIAACLQNIPWGGGGSAPSICSTPRTTCTAHKARGCRISIHRCCFGVGARLL